MAIQKIKDDILYVGSRHWDRPIFDELVELSKGTSYNAYLVKGSEKTVLIDTVDPDKTYELLRNLKVANVKKIDYIISNHAEQDHSGSIPDVLNIYPEAKIITNEKCKSLLQEFMQINDNKFIIINDNDELSLGNKTLKFLFTPWVHWPETMTTYLKEDKIMFTCDFFGSHIATSRLFGPKDEKLVYESAKHYYAEIMMPFRTNIRKNIKKIEEFEFDMICPSHGVVYKNPDFIINAYKRWTSDEVDNEVLIPYISMHGSIKEIVEYLADGLIEKNIFTRPINLAETELGELAMDLVDAATVIFAAPFVLAGAHPKIISTAYIANSLRPKTKFLGIVASYGWGGNMIDHIKSVTKNIKAQLLEPVLIKGKMNETDHKNLDNLISVIESKHKDLGILK